MPTDKKLILAVKILGALLENQSRGLTVEEIKRIYIKDKYTSQWAIQEVLNGLAAEKLVEKKFSSITRGQTKEEIILYCLTSEGMKVYLQLRKEAENKRRDI
jgi:hypothetical protein